MHSLYVSAIAKCLEPLYDSITSLSYSCIADSTACKTDDMANELVALALASFFLFLLAAGEEKCCFKVDKETKQIIDSNGKTLLYNQLNYWLQYLFILYSPFIGRARLFHGVNIVSSPVSMIIPYCISFTL